MLLAHAKANLYFILILAVFLPKVLSQSEPVDFGDSGLVVVVQQQGEPKSENSDESWSFWFPDEFINLWSGWIKSAPGLIPTFPDPGGDGGQQPDCDDLINELGDELRLAELLTEAINNMQKFPVEIIHEFDPETGKVLSQTSHLPGSFDHTSAVLDRLRFKQATFNHIDELLMQAVSQCAATAED